MIIVKNYKIVIISNNSLNPAHPIAVAQAKPQPKHQMRVVLPYKLTVYLYVDPNAHALCEALQEAVVYTHALHEALQDTAPITTKWLI